MILEKVKQFVNDSFQGKKIKHFERTLYWVKKLRPDSDETMLIAAYGHDIERAFRTPETTQKVLESDKGFLDENFLKHHQEKGAEILGEFVRKNGANEEVITRVKMLVSKHEVGGNPEQDFLKDCDSISFFETSANHFVTDKVNEIGKEKVKLKLDWMYNRISSDKARDLAKPMYDKFAGELA